MLHCRHLRCWHTHGDFGAADRDDMPISIIPFAARVVPQWLLPDLRCNLLNSPIFSGQCAAADELEDVLWEET